MIQLYTKDSYQVKIVFNYKSEGVEEKNLQNPYGGKFLSCHHLTETDRLKVLIGLGNFEEFNPKKIKSAVAKGVKQAKTLGMNRCMVDVSLLIERFDLQCLWDIVEGIKLGLYAFRPYKKDQKEEAFHVYLEGIKEEFHQQAEEIIKKAENVVDGIIMARDMVNTPGNRLTPAMMADKILELGKETNLSIEVLEESRLKELGMEAFLAVGSSSGNPPRLIVMRYNGDENNKEITGLIGKGVTCDTGGYCLKSSGSMTGIKGDMAGGAAVLGTLYALAKNQVKANVVGIIPACENRISRESFLPGDVIESMSGKTIEILNTDAEGRLILADAVTYAIQQEGVTRMVDIATLTGSVVNALGFTTAGLLTNDETFYEDFKVAYERAGEQYWRLPIYDEYRDLIKSDIADIKNIGKNYCGTISAGLFIEAFVEQLPWIHLDIAGTAWVDPAIFEYQSKGATGAGVTSMYFLLEKEC